MKARHWTACAIACRRTEVAVTVAACHVVYAIHRAGDFCGARAARAFGRQATDAELLELVAAARAVWGTDR